MRFSVIDRRIRNKRQIVLFMITIAELSAVAP